MEESRQGHIGRTLLQVEDDRSDEICDLLGAHDRITTNDRRGCVGSGIRTSGNTVNHLRKTVALVD